MTSRPLRILQLVTLISPAGEFGGPVTVAVNQCRELRRRGHDVVLVAASRGFDQVPTEIDGVPVRLFPARPLIPGVGFAGLTAPGMLRWLSRHVREYDVVHVHLARDLVTLPAAELVRRAGRRYVLQTHGMIDRSSRRSAAAIDWLLTHKVLDRADRVLYLTEVERADLEQVRAGLRLRRLCNGVPIPGPDDRVGARREVLFMARLHPRKRPELVVRAAAALASSHPDWTFVLAGPDEGSGTTVSALIERHGLTNVDYVGPVSPDRVLDRLRAASVSVLPAVNEPLGMSVLEAMSVGLPVVVTDSCGLAAEIAARGAGLVCDSSVEGFVHAVRRLLDDPALRTAAGRQARQTVADSFGIEPVVDHLLASYLASDDVRFADRMRGTPR